MSDEAEKAFPYPLADNERNRTVFASGYQAGRAARDAEVEKWRAENRRSYELQEGQAEQILALREQRDRAIEIAQEANDDCRKWQQLAARDAVIGRVREFAAELARPEEYVDGWIPTGIEDILNAAPKSVLAEHDARVLEEFAATLRERYPDDVFVRPSDEDYDRLNKALARSNISLDRFSADLMRRVAAQIDQEAAERREGAGQ